MLGELLLRQLNELRQNQVLCDLELIATDKSSVFVHKIVWTALNRNHFQQAFRTARHTKPPSLHKMFLSSITGQELNIFVDFLYGVTINKQSQYDSLVSTLSKLEMTYLLEEAGDFALENDNTVKKEKDFDIHGLVNDEREEHITNKEIIEVIQPNFTSTNLLTVLHDIIKSEVSSLDSVHGDEELLHANYEERSLSTVAEGDGTKIIENTVKKLTPERDIDSGDGIVLNYETGVLERTCRHSEANLADVKQEICTTGDNFTKTKNHTLNEQHAIENMINTVQIKQEIESIQPIHIDSSVNGNDCRSAEGQVSESVYEVLEKNVDSELTKSISVKQESDTGDTNICCRISKNQDDNQLNSTYLKPGQAKLGCSTEKSFTNIDTLQIKQEPELIDSDLNSNENIFIENNKTRVVTSQNEHNNDIKLEVNPVNTCQNDVYNDTEVEHGTMGKSSQNEKSDNEVEYSEMSPLLSYGSPCKYQRTEDYNIDLSSKEITDCASTLSVCRIITNDFNQGRIGSQNNVKFPLPQQGFSTPRSSEGIFHRTPTNPPITTTSYRVPILQFSIAESSFLTSLIQTSAVPTVMTTTHKYCTVGSKDSPVHPCGPKNTSILSDNPLAVPKSVQHFRSSVPTKSKAQISLLNSAKLPAFNQVSDMQTLSLLFPSIMSESVQSSYSSSNLVSLLQAPYRAAVPISTVANTSQSQTLTYVSDSCARACVTNGQIGTPVTQSRPKNASQCSIRTQSPCLPLLTCTTSLINALHNSSNAYALSTPSLSFTCSSTTKALRSSTMTCASCSSMPTCSKPVAKFSCNTPVSLTPSFSTITQDSRNVSRLLAPCTLTMPNSVFSSTIKNDSCKSKTISPISSPVTNTLWNGIVRLTAASCNSAITNDPCNATESNVYCSQTVTCALSCSTVTSVTYAFDSSSKIHASCNNSVMSSSNRPSFPYASEGPTVVTASCNVINTHPASSKKQTCALLLTERSPEESVVKEVSEPLYTSRANTIVFEKSSEKSSFCVESSIYGKSRSMFALSKTNETDDTIEEQILKKSKDISKPNRRKPLFKKSRNIEMKVEEQNKSFKDMSNKSIENAELDQQNSPIFEKDDGTQNTDCQETDVLVESAAAFLKISEKTYIKKEGENSENTETEIMQSAIRGEKHFVKLGKRGDKSATSAVNKGDSLDTNFQDSNTPIESTSKICNIPTAEIVKLTPDDIKTAVKRKSIYNKNLSIETGKKKQIKKASTPESPETIVKTIVDNTVEIGRIESVEPKSCQMSIAKNLQVHSRISDPAQPETVASVSDDSDTPIKSTTNKCIIPTAEILKVIPYYNSPSKKKTQINTNNYLVNETYETEGMNNVTETDGEPLHCESIHSKIHIKDLEDKTRSVKTSCAVEILESEYLEQRYNYEFDNQNLKKNENGTSVDTGIRGDCVVIVDNPNGKKVSLSERNDELQVKVFKNSPKLTTKCLQDYKKIVNESKIKLGTTSNKNDIVFPIRLDQANTESELDESTDEADEIVENIQLGKNDVFQFKGFENSSKISEDIKLCNGKSKTGNCLVQFNEKDVSNGQKDCTNFLNESEREQLETLLDTADVALSIRLDQSNTESELDVGTSDADISNQTVELFQHDEEFVDPSKEHIFSSRVGSKPMEQVSVNSCIPKNQSNNIQDSKGLSDGLNQIIKDTALNRSTDNVNICSDITDGIFEKDIVDQNKDSFIMSSMGASPSKKKPTKEGKASIQSNSIQGSKNEKSEAVNSTIPSLTISNKELCSGLNTDIPIMLKGNQCQKQVTVANDIILTSTLSQNKLRKSPIIQSTNDKTLLPRIPVLMMRYPLSLQVFGPSNKLGLYPINSPVITRTCIPLNENSSNPGKNISGVGKRNMNASGEKRKRHKSVPDNTSIMTKKKMKRSGSQELLKVNRKINLNKECKRKKSVSNQGSCSSKKKKMNEVSVIEVDTDENGEEMEVGNKNLQRLVLYESDTDIDLPLSELKEKLSNIKESPLEKNIARSEKISDKENNDKDSFMRESLYQNEYDNVGPNNVPDENDLEKRREYLVTQRICGNTTNEQCVTELDDEKRHINIEITEEKGFENKNEDNLFHSPRSLDSVVTESSEVREAMCEGIKNRSITHAYKCIAKATDTLKVKSEDERTCKQDITQPDVIDLTRHENETKRISFGIPGVVQESSPKVFLEPTPELRKALNLPVSRLASLECIKCKQCELSCKTGSARLKAGLCDHCFENEEMERLKVFKIAMKNEIEKGAVKDGYVKQKSTFKDCFSIEKTKKADLRNQSQRRNSSKIKKVVKFREPANVVSEESKMPSKKAKKKTKSKKLLQKKQKLLNKMDENKEKDVPDQVCLNGSANGSLASSSIVLHRPILPKFKIHDSKGHSPKIFPLQNVFHSASLKPPTQTVSSDSIDTVSTLQYVAVTTSSKTTMSSPSTLLSGVPLMSSAINGGSNLKHSFYDLVPATTQPQVFVMPANLVNKHVKEKKLSFPTSKKLKKVLPKPDLKFYAYPVMTKSAKCSEEVKMPIPVQTMTPFASPVLSSSLTSSSCSSAASKVPSSPALSELLASKPLAPSPNPSILIFKSPINEIQKDKKS